MGAERVAYHAAMVDLLLASQNPGKLAEMKQLVEGLPFRIVGPRDVGIMAAPEETGTTFAENAILKARHYAQLSGLLAVADDSGISVDAMNGEPGLYSSRFGGEGASDADRNRLLLERLKGVPADRRGARFTSAVAVARGAEILFQVVEVVEGRIADEVRGAERLRLRSALLLPALRQDLRRGGPRGEGPGQPPRQGLRAAAGVPRDPELRTRARLRLRLQQRHVPEGLLLQRDRDRRCPCRPPSSAARARRR